METFNRLQKVETSDWLPKEYEVTPGEEAKPYILENNKMIRTRPSLLRVK